MSDKPILFSAPMVRALIEGRKTQTRRTLNPQPHLIGTTGSYIGKDGKGHKIRIAVGDRLYVREHWRTSGSVDATPPRDLPRSAAILFEADGLPAPMWRGKHRQAMHMPRWASRLTLIVTDVRVERLQDISREDAKAEGLEWVAPTYGIGGIASTWNGDPRESYFALWDHINGPGAWKANPFVTTYTFTVHHGNIDQIAKVAA